MTEHQIDSNSLRAEMRALPRGTLLLIAERAIELVTRDQLGELLGDIVHINVDPADASSADAAAIVGASLLDQVRSFHDDAMGGEYYEHVEINNRGQQKQSESTDAFIAEFDRLMRKCVAASEADIEPDVGDSFAHEVRNCFELLFALLRHIDEGNDDVLFFADDGGASDVGVNWRTALSAYFNCLAKSSSPEEFAQTVDFAIEAFSPYDRPHYLTLARNVANDGQRIALDTFMT